MMPHLSSEQLSECVCGWPSPLVARHIEDCAACRAELAEMRETLGNFRTGVRAWSEQRAATLATPETAVVRADPRGTPRQLAWALAIAALCVVASFVLPRRQNENTAARDAALLNRVQAQMSRSVPSSMEPLMKLVVDQQVDEQ